MSRTNPPNLQNDIHQRLEAAFTEVAAGLSSDGGGSDGDGDGSGDGTIDPLVHRSQLADFQADAAMALGSRLKRAPRDLAQAVVDAVELDDLCDRIEVAGPGFINLFLADDALSRYAAAMAADQRLGVAASHEPDRVVVDYSAPNVAKEMHVGHLRSTVIGDAVVRLLTWMGHDIIRENHIGDWGTPFGMLIEHMIDIGTDEAAAELSVGDLTGFYQSARRKFDDDESFADRARARVVELQQGDERTLELWRTLIAESQTYFMAVYDRLDVRLTDDDFMGESAYNDQLASVADELDELGLLVESDGADCVFPDGFTNRDGEPLPLIVRNRVGGYGYASTDLATIRHRLRDLKADRLVYVVGLPQKLHLDMVFQTAREAGWLTGDRSAEHVGFGSVLGTDGKTLRTRAGASVKLSELLDEAIVKAEAAIEDKNPDLDAETKTAVARQVGIGAIKLADLSSERKKDYVFDFDRMLSFEGNTAPYLQYAHARICSIFRRGEVVDVDALGPIVVAEDQERELVLALLDFPRVVTDAADTLDLHPIAHYLFALARTFTSFYENCPVLRADEATRSSRLALCRLTARTLAQGLDLLGIVAPERM